jgi:hypothetical protein
LQLSADNGSSFFTTGYAVRSTVGIIGSSIIGRQNGTTETSVELGIFAAGDGNAVVGRVAMSLDAYGTNNSVMGTFTSTCTRASTDYITMEGGFRRSSSSGINAIKLFVAGGTITGKVTVKGIPN